jgi:hypothetical protein
MYAAGAVPSNVAITCIYTATDLAYEPAAREPHASNYEVNGTHELLGVNARVYRLLAESLAIPDGVEEIV